MSTPHQLYDDIINTTTITTFHYNNDNNHNHTAIHGNATSSYLTPLVHDDLLHLSITPSSTPGMGNASVETTNPRLINGVVNLLLMLFNIGGNGLVLFVYHSLFRNTVFNLFVKALASLDLLTAMTTMLIDVMMKLRRNDESHFDTNAMCKLSHYQVYANSLASGCVLILIAYQRYRKICHPLERGMVLRRAKLLLLVIGLACLVMSIPTVFLYGPLEVKTLVRQSEVTTTICRVDPRNQDSPLTMAFNYLLMAAFSFVLVVTCVLYCLISRSIRKFENRNSALFSPALAIGASSPRSCDDDGDDDDEEEEEEDENDDVEGRRSDRSSPYGRYVNSPYTTGTAVMTSPVHGRNPINPDNRILHNYQQQHQLQLQHHNNGQGPQSPYALNATVKQPQPQRATAAAAGGHDKRENSQTKNDKQKKHKGDNANNNHHHNNHRRQQQQQDARRMSSFTMAASRNEISTQMYRVFTIITVVFIVSYLPHLVALVLTKMLHLDERVLSYGQRVALEFAYNCPYISTVSNPIIYGFSSAEFRDRVRDLLQSCDEVVRYCCCCCCCGEGCYCCCCCDDEDDFDGDGCCDGGGFRGCMTSCQVFECCRSCADCDED